MEHALGQADAQAILRWLGQIGVLRLDAPSPASPCCAPPHWPDRKPCAQRRRPGGVRTAVGQRVQAGELVAELIDPISGDCQRIHARSMACCMHAFASAMCTPVANWARWPVPRPSQRPLWVSETHFNDHHAPESFKLQVENLHKRYGNQEVLKGVSLSAHAGDVISIIGSSGSGKEHLPALHQPAGETTPRPYRRCR